MNGSRGAALAVALAATLGAPAAVEGDDEGMGKGQAAIVLELYTSQGCYSCPPADRLLARLGEQASAHGRLLIPLAFHVDYWNYIGWTDPFSSERWTDRQRAYRRVLRQRTIYTPQLVIDGWRQCVGSDERTARREIERVSQAASVARVDLEVSAAGDVLEIRVAAEIEGRVDARALEAWVAVFESGLVTEVPRGENADKTLANEYVVRSLDRAFEIAATAGANRSASLELELDAGWNRDDLGIAVFLQDPDSLRIYGASAARPAS